MVLDNLAVSITSQVADVKTGISSVRSSFVDLAATTQGTAGRLDEASDEMDELTRSAVPLIASTQILQGRLDEAGDEARNLGLQSGFAANLVTTLGFSSEGAALGVTTLSTSLTLALIPAVLTLATILAPLVATLGVLAAVGAGAAGGLAAVIGTGVIAGFDKLRTTLENTLLVLETLLVGVGQEFVPLLLEGIRALPGILREVISAAGDLTPFADALGELGGIAADALPGLVSELADLGRDALPTIISVARTLAEDGPGAFRMLKDSADTALPILQQIGSAFADLAPPLLRFGTNVLEVVGPAFADLVSLTADALRFFNSLGQDVRAVAIGFSVLLPVIVPVISFISTLIATFTGYSGILGVVISGLSTLVAVLGGPVTAVILLAIGLIAAWETDFLGFKSTVLDIADDIMDAFGDIEDVIKDVISSVGDDFDGFVRSAVEMLNGLIKGLNDFIRAANSTGLTDIDTIDLVETPEFAQTGTAEFSQNRQDQRQMIDVRIQSDDEKFKAEVKELSGGEFVRLQNAQADRADRIRPQ